MADTDAFFTPDPTDDYTLSAAAADGDARCRFRRAFTTPHPENNTVYCRLVTPVAEAPHARGGAGAAAMERRLRADTSACAGCWR